MGRVGGAGLVGPRARMGGVPFPPLVDPGPPLTAAALARHARHLLVPGVGESGQRRLAAARVLVVGAGGLGSPVLLYLAAAGVGTLGIADDDTVATSNLARQIVHGSTDVGRAKVASAAETLHRLDPAVVVRTHGRLTDLADATRTVAGYDLVVDGTDTFDSRYLVADATTAAGVPHVWGAVLRLAGQASVFWTGRGPVYRDVFAAPPAAGSVPSCAEGGIVAAVCGAVGSVLALEAVKLVCGLGAPLVGRLLTFDGLTTRWREVSLATPTAPTTAPHITAQPTTAAPTAVGAAGPQRLEVPVDVLAARLRAREAGVDDFVLVDVREPGERLINDIPGAVGIPLGEFTAGRAAGRLPAGVPVVLYCHRGVRSAHALDLLVAAGVGGVAHVPGGTGEWVRRVDPSQPDY